MTSPNSETPPTSAGDKTVRAPIWPLLALLAGNAALSIGPYFVRLSDSGPVSAGFWRLMLALPFLYAIAFVRNERPFAQPPRVLLTIMLAGVLFALDLASWHIGIEQTRMANAALFGNSGSLILMLWAFVMLRKQPGRLEWLAIAMALIGSALLMGRSAELSTRNLIGDAFCVLAGLFYAFYILLMAKGRNSLGPWSVLAHASLAGAPVLLVLALLLDEPFMPTWWLPLIGLAFSSQIIGQGLLTYALKHFSPMIVGLALLTQPAMAAALGWFAFGEILGPIDYMGMLLVGLALAIGRRQPEPVSAVDTPLVPGDDRPK